MSFTPLLFILDRSFLLSLLVENALGVHQVFFTNQAQAYSVAFVGDSRGVVGFNFSLSLQLKPDCPPEVYLAETNKIRSL